MDAEGKLFQRRLEDFSCERCAWMVAGDGYTNHCPKCLYSRHVDISPGDRRSECRGMMEPIGLERDMGFYRLTHRCERCGHEKRNKVSEEDDFEVLLGLSRRGGLV